MKDPKFRTIEEVNVYYDARCAKRWKRIDNFGVFVMLFIPAVPVFLFAVGKLAG